MKKQKKDKDVVVKQSYLDGLLAICNLFDTVFDGVEFRIGVEAIRKAQNLPGIYGLDVDTLDLDAAIEDELLDPESKLGKRVQKLEAEIEKLRAKKS